MYMQKNQNIIKESQNIRILESTFKLILIWNTRVEKKKTMRHIKSLTVKIQLKKEHGTINFWRTKFRYSWSCLWNQCLFFFVSITGHFEPVVPVEPLPNVIHKDLLVSEKDVFSDLSKLATNKAMGPDEISNRLLIEFAPEFASIIKDTYNQSLKDGFTTDPVKKSIIAPVAKVSPPANIKNNLRPIGQTNCLAKVLEGFTHRRLLNQIERSMDTRQYVRKGHSTTHAFTYLLHIIYEDVADTENFVVLAYFLQTLQKDLTSSIITSCYTNWVLFNRSNCICMN